MTHIEHPWLTGRDQGATAQMADPPLAMRGSYAKDKPGQACDEAASVRDDAGQVSNGRTPGR